MIVATAGPDFIRAALPLQILIWATGLIFINAQLRFVLTALDEERTYWRLICWTLAVKVGLEAVMIPLWGLYGACVGNLLGEVAPLRWRDVRPAKVPRYRSSVDSVPPPAARRRCHGGGHVAVCPSRRVVD